MTEKKNLTQDGLTIPNTLLILTSIAMIAVCLYLTNHYFETLFPTKLGDTSGLCDISSFFNCNAATTSQASNILGVPIALFGMLIGTFLLIGSIFPSQGMEKTNSLIVKLNLAGCMILFLYSLISLGSLCPMCTLYYLLSAVAFFLFAKYSSARWEFDPKILGSFLIVALGSSFFMYRHYHKKKLRQLSLNTQIIKQFFALEDLGDPVEESNYDLAIADEDFSKAPIRVSIFSDFQCPFCAKEAKQFEKLAQDYQGKINIQYFFYPLDKTCNEKVKGNFHQFACAAANVAACDPQKFKLIHDEIFNNQDSLSFAFIEKLAAKYEVTDCYQKKMNQEKILKSMEIANNYNIKSTPTLILNGKKIEGAIGTSQFKAIFDAILDQ